MLDGVGMALGVDAGKGGGTQLVLLPLVIDYFFSFNEFEAAIVAPGIQNDGLRPVAITRGQEHAVVLRPFSLVSHAAADAEELQFAAAQFAVYVVGIVPAKPALLEVEAGIDEAVVEPPGQAGVVEARDGGGGFVGGVCKPACFLLRGALAALLFRQQIQQASAERLALLYQRGAFCVAQGWRILAGCQQEQQAKAEQG